LGSPWEPGTLRDTRGDRPHAVGMAGLLTAKAGRRSGGGVAVNGAGSASISSVEELPANRTSKREVQFSIARKNKGPRRGPSFAERDLSLTARDVFFLRPVPRPGRAHPPLDRRTALRSGGPDIANAEGIRGSGPVQLRPTSTCSAVASEPTQPQFQPLRKTVGCEVPSMPQKRLWRS